MIPALRKFVLTTHITFSVGWLGAVIATGLIQALATPWGLFRHYWIVTKLLLTTVATIILLKHMPTVSRTAGLMIQDQSSSSGLGVLPTQLVIHAAGGLLVLCVITIISMYKPWGMTPYGRRKQQKPRTVSPPISTTSIPSQVKIFGALAIILVLVFFVMHVIGRGLSSH